MRVDQLNADKTMWVKRSARDSAFDPISEGIFWKIDFTETQI